jgi:hypothetical protein
LSCLAFLPASCASCVNPARPCETRQGSWKTRPLPTPRFILPAPSGEGGHCNHSVWSSSENTIVFLALCDRLAASALQGATARQSLPEPCWRQRSPESKRLLCLLATWMSRLLIGVWLSPKPRTTQWRTWQVSSKFAVGQISCQLPSVAASMAPHARHPNTATLYPVAVAEDLADRLRKDPRI